MLESIYIGMTGLLGYSRGLRVISNNTANINTPGFKSSTLQFSDLFYSNGNISGGYRGQGGSLGYGLNTNGTTQSFTQGELRATGNPLDMAIDGQGLFTLRSPDGSISYTRAGQFQFNRDGVLINQNDDSKVMGRDFNGAFTEISINGLNTSAGKATATAVFRGNVSSTAAEQIVGSIIVIDALGASRVLSAKFTNAGSTIPGGWNVQVLDGTSVIGTGVLVFQDGRPTLASSKISINYAASGGQSTSPLLLDFSNDVTSYASGNLSTLTFLSQDGYEAGALTKVSFDTAGTLVLNYSNGQAVKGTRLALGSFSSQEAVGGVGDNRFEALDSRAWTSGVAGSGVFGSIRSGLIEISNVDLSQQFSDLVIMQRGYQASSQIISTANEMLQELFSMKSK
jgi:flagellar hook protein FlgE